MSKNILGKYSYFSKVEWEFYGISGNSRVMPETDQITEASEKMLKAVLPILEDEHWPDWDAANAD